MNRKERRIQQKKRSKAGGSSGAPDIGAAVEKAITCHQAGDLDAAEKAYNEILAALPTHADSYHMLGILSLQRGDIGAALERVDNALTLNNAAPNYYKTRGNILMQAGGYEEALIAYERSISIEPSYAEGHYHLGLCLQKLRRFKDAEEAYAAACRLRPIPEAINNLGVLQRRFGGNQKAISFFNQAIAHNKNYSEAWSNLGLTLIQENELKQGLDCLLQAMLLEPENNKYKAYLGIFSQNIAFNSYSAPYRDAVYQCLKNKNVAAQNFFNLWFSLFNLSEEWGAIHDLIRIDDYAAFKAALEGGDTLEFPEYFTLGVQKLLIANLDVELFLRHARRYFLEQIAKGEVLRNPSFERLLCALTQQGFASDYVLQLEADEEVPLLEKIRARVEAAGEAPAVFDVLILACYMPLHTLENNAGARRVLNASGNETFSDIACIQIDEPQEERTIAQSMPALGTLNDPVSLKVRAQYEENPYPRWRTANIYDSETEDKYGDLIDDDRLKAQILIAGCGTGQHVMRSALSIPNSEILAVDLSLASLSYAARKVKEFGVPNIEFMQADILELGQVDRTFDIIESSGVLHHMDDPIKGWCVLYDLLKPGGRMKIGLYSELARQHIVMAREMIAEKGFESTPEGIRACREYIKTLPKDDLMYNLFLSRDFFSLSECRDLIFHVQEHRFTIPKIKAFLQEKRLEFLGFNFTQPMFLKMYSSVYPDDTDMTNLDNWHALEQTNPTMFAGMYQFWLRKANQL